MGFTTLKCFMKGNALKEITNDSVTKQYKHIIDRFTTWAKTQKIRSVEQLRTKDEKANLINKYKEKLLSEGKSAATIHTYLSPICSGLGLHLGRYKLGRDDHGETIWGYDGVSSPIRHAIEIEKGRMADLKNPRNLEDIKDPQFARLVDAAERIGIRRSEYARLTGKSFGIDVCGKPCVTIKGKGGKVQSQRILPDDVEAVKQLFDGTAKKVFSPEEMRNKIDLHTLRRQHAQKCYNYYVEQVKSGKGDQLRRELLKTFIAYHYKGKSFILQKRFLSQLDRAKGVYTLRGQNRDRAMIQKQEACFDRLALMCTSVWHLSHWRLDVTIRHYML